MNFGQITSVVGEAAPERRGRHPRRLRAVTLRLASGLLFASLAAALGAGCANTGDNQVAPPTAVGMTSTMTPYYSDQELTLYQAQVPVQLPVRQPTADERKALGKQTPYPHAPWITVDDERIEIRFTLSNIDDTPHAIELLFDAWNEFDRYKPGIQVVSDDETTPDFSTNDKFYIVPAKSRVEGTLTADDTREMAVDLATAERIQANDPPLGEGVSANALMNHAMNLQNRSTQPDPILQPWIPTSGIPGLTGFDLGIRTTEQANVAVEITVDITDLNGNKIIPQGETMTSIGKPSNELQPPKAAAE